MTGWRPLLEGDDAERALESVAAIVAAITHAPDNEPSPALSGGDAGVALLFSTIGDTAKALDLLDRATRVSSRGPMHFSLFGGFGGIAWAVNRLRREPTDAVDSLLLDVLRSEADIDFDLVNGLVGVGVYALERAPTPAAGDLLDLVVELLAASASHEPDGTTWHREHSHGGRVHRVADAGLAHGVAGIVALLALAGDRRLLESAVHWLLANRLPPGAPSRFPDVVDPVTGPRAARTAWCYGDPGVATALLLASRATGDDAWERIALETAVAAAQRASALCGVRDPALCHGAAGLALVFARLAHAFDYSEPSLEDAARRWARETLAFRRPGTGVAGYAYLDPPTEQWVAQRGVLEGAAGVALALHALATSTPPAWDRFMLLS